MKRNLVFLSIVLIFTMLFSSCQMEPVVPEDQKTISGFSENENLYTDCVNYVSSLGFDALISRVDYWSPEGSEEMEGLYIQNMDDNSFIPCKEPCVVALFENTDVKMIDFISRDELNLCSFSLCLASKNFDFGFYFVSSDKPLYFGDLSAELTENGQGYSYEQKASYGVKFTYYTEKMADNFYYYEIT